MKAVMLMFDTLTRHYLPNYGCALTKMPNFERLQKRSVTFDEFYGGSMPCMPARRELHTGRYNFLHRGWGPIEPFDISCIELMKNAGIYTHLVTDHSHYWEDGGATYHSRYNTYEFFRGQEGDRWTPQWSADRELNTCALNKQNESAIQHLANRTRIVNEEDMPSVQTVGAGLDFINRFHERDQWFLQIECFDPHEPFLVPDKYRDLYECVDRHEAFNFPAYCFVDGKYSDDEIQQLRKEYFALLSMCDAQLGRVLDAFDQYDMWKDTMLIVNTDHGFFLGEHNFIGKNIPPLYDEVIHIPFFIHDPRVNRDGERRLSLAQTIDIPPTLMHYFGLNHVPEMQGRDLSPVIQDDEKIHDTVLYGVHGGLVTVYDGRYAYMRGTRDNRQIYHMTLMPTLMRGFIPTSDINRAEFVDGGKFTNHTKVLQIPCDSIYGTHFAYPDALYDKQNDPQQCHSLKDEELTSQMIQKLIAAMENADAPEWQYERLDLKHN